MRVIIPAFQKLSKLVSKSYSDALSLHWRRGLLAALTVALFGLCYGQPARAAAPKKASGDGVFVGQSQITVTVMRALRPVGVLQADVGILVVNPTQRARAQQLQPLLKDAWRRTTQEFANSYITPGRAPDAVLLGQRLQNATDQIVGQGVARVLFTSLIVR